MEKYIISSVFLMIMFLIFNCLFSMLADMFLENASYKKIYRIPFGLLNCLLAFFFTFFKDTSSMISYSVLFLVLFVETSVYFKRQFKQCFFFVSTVLMHFMSARAVCVAAVAIISKTSIFEVANESQLLMFSMCATFFMINVIFFMILRFIPKKRLRLINNNQEQLWFMIAWVAVFNAYLLLNSRVYSKNEIHSLLIQNQYIMPIVILIGLYIVMFFAIKTIELRGYKEKNQELEIAIFKEQQLRSSMISDAIATYEFNLTEDTIIIESIDHPSPVADTGARYSETVDSMSRQLIFADDIIPFIKYASPKNLIEEFNSGKVETTFEYRRLMPNGGYIWVSAVTNLLKDVVTGDVKGFCYIKDINEHKKIQLELKFKAERDSLTGLYNKGTSGKIIAEYLHSLEGKNLTAALFIIDVDNFKTINDQLGHTFGDAVLCELGERLQRIFRADDIVGRVGGDEFIAFMKDIKDAQIAKKKAQEICDAFKNTYKSVDQTEHRISSSVGICVYPLGGTDYLPLYERADTALYSSKNKGKDTFTIYNGETFSGYQSTRTAIDNKGTVPQKNFKENRVEYIFKILYGSADSIAAVRSVLELLASHFNFSRGYIFEHDSMGLTSSNTFEWCASGVSPQIDQLQGVPLEIMGRATQAIRSIGMYIMKNPHDIPDIERNILEPQGIKSMLQFGVFEGEKIVGFIGFDDCENELDPTGIEIDEISTICNILATFIVKQRAIEKAERNAQSMTEIMNNLDSYAYVVDKATHDILFINNKADKIVLSKVNVGYCYQSIRGKDKPCQDCPIEELSDDFTSRCVKVIRNERFNIWTETTASYINWEDGKTACLINSIDITKYKTQAKVKLLEEKVC